MIMEKLFHNVLCKGLLIYDLHFPFDFDCFSMMLPLYCMPLTEGTLRRLTPVPGVPGFLNLAVTPFCDTFNISVPFLTCLNMDPIRETFLLSTKGIGLVLHWILSKCWWHFFSMSNSTKNRTFSSYKCKVN